jgi:hypothetical protein
MAYDPPWVPQSSYCKQRVEWAVNRTSDYRELMGAVQRACRKSQVQRGQLVCNELKEWPQVLSYKWATGRLLGALHCWGGAARLKQGILSSSDSMISLSKKKAPLASGKCTSFLIFPCHNLHLNLVRPGNLPTTQVWCLTQWQSSHGC